MKADVKDNSSPSRAGNIFGGPDIQPLFVILAPGPQFGSDSRARFATSNPRKNGRRNLSHLGDFQSTSAIMSTTVLFEA